MLTKHVKAKVTIRLKICIELKGFWEYEFEDHEESMRGKDKKKPIAYNQIVRAVW